MEVTSGGVCVSVRCVGLIHIIISVVSFYYRWVVDVCEVPFEPLVISGDSCVVVGILRSFVCFELFVEGSFGGGDDEFRRIYYRALVLCDVCADMVFCERSQSGYCAGEEPAVVDSGEGHSFGDFTFICCVVDCWCVVGGHAVSGLFPVCIRGNLERCG